MRTDVRDLPELWPLRQRRNAGILCGLDPEPYRAVSAALEELRAQLVVETEPGRLSAALGRPSVTVADRLLGS